MSLTLIHGEERKNMEKEDKERLIRILDFLDAELKDLKAKFLALDYQTYQRDRDKRRNMERCLENIVNSSLDLAKIILINENLPIPATYREYFLELVSTNLIAEENAERLASGVKLRNVLAHQYLDIKWDSIKRFLQEDWKSYPLFVQVIKESYLKD